MIPVRSRFRHSDLNCRSVSARASMCTNWLGAVNGNAADIKQRVALKILGRSPVERQLAFASERGWRHLDFVQTARDDYANDLSLINADGSENPALVVFKRDCDKVRLFWASEMTSLDGRKTELTVRAAPRKDNVARDVVHSA